MESIPKRSRREKWWPVVAYIVLIATVLIAEAYLYEIMFSPVEIGDRLRIEHLVVTSGVWDHHHAYFNMTVNNRGGLDSSIVCVEVNDEHVMPNAPVLPYTLPKDQKVTIKIADTFRSGTQYEFSVLTATGHRFEYTQTAP